jgi:hypothetical protein
MMIFFGVIGVLALGFGIGVVIMSIAEADSSLTFAGLGLVFGGGLLLIGSLAAGNASEPECDKVYEPDGSYTETCTYEE